MQLIEENENNISQTKRKGEEEEKNLEYKRN